MEQVSELQEFDKVKADLAEIVQKGNFIPDVTTDEGFNASKDYVVKVTTKARTRLTKAHKDAKAFYLDGGRKVDSMKNELMNQILEAERPHKEAYKALEDERKRIKQEELERVEAGFSKLKGYQQQALNSSSSEISELIAECSEFEPDPEIYKKEIEQITILFNQTMDSLTTALTSAIEREELEKEVEEARKIKADAQAKKEAEEAEILAAQEREIVRAEAEKQAKTEAEQAIKDKEAALKREAEAKEQQRIQSIKSMYPSSRIAGFSGLKPSDYQAELERLKFVNIGPEFQEFADEALALLNNLIKTLCNDYSQAVELEKQVAENQRIAAEEEAKRIAKAKADAEAAAIEKRKADKAHRDSILNAAYSSLVSGGLEPGQAKLAVSLIAKKLVSNVTINY